MSRLSPRLTPSLLAHPIREALQSAAKPSAADKDFPELYRYNQKIKLLASIANTELRSNNLPMQPTLSDVHVQLIDETPTPVTPQS